MSEKTFNKHYCKAGATPCGHFEMNFDVIFCKMGRNNELSPPSLPLTNVNTCPWREKIVPPDETKYERAMDMITDAKLSENPLEKRKQVIQILKGVGLR